MPGGNKNIKGTDGNTFSAENQPSPESKSKGRKESEAFKKIAKTMIRPNATINEILEVVKVCFGIEPGQEISVETLMHLKQMEKAVKDGDTRAYIAVMDRLKGKPLQQTQDLTARPQVNIYTDGLTKEDIKI